MTALNMYTCENILLPASNLECKETRLTCGQHTYKWDKML